MMNWIVRKLLRFRKDESGAALFYVTLAIPTIIAITSMAVDLGYVWYVKTRLQTAADMGALAGASKLYTANAQAVTDLSTTYVNFNLPTDWTGGNKPSVNSTPEVRCIPAIEDMGLTCSTQSGGNALKVTVNATVPLFFATALGFKTFNLSANSVVTGGGSSPPPLNVAIVLDATRSMDSPVGSGVTCGTLINPSKIECAMVAAKTLLTKLWASIDQVALYTYPPFDAQSLNVATCPTGTSRGSLGQVSYATRVATQNYQLIPFTHDYADTANPPTPGLYTTSGLVRALGRAATSATAADSTTCAGLATSGLGIGTSIADAIKAAQQGLKDANLALDAAHQPRRQNVMIILSDGDANGNSESLLGPCGDNAFVATTDNYGFGITQENRTGCPRFKASQWVVDVEKMADQCQAAVDAAHAAAEVVANEGTWVYSIAFAASSSARGSCFTDRLKTSVPKTTTTTPPLTVADNLVLSSRSCSRSKPCQAIAAVPDTRIISTVAPPDSSKIQVATTTWGKSRFTECNASNGATSGTCKEYLVPTKVQTDTYDLNTYKITACEAMQDIASDPSRFYSTDGGDTSAGKCPSTANPDFTDLVAIFNNVAASIMKKRRIPNSLAP